jgi:hypothetical protein
LLMRKFSHSRNQHCFAIKIIASIDQICLRLFQKPLFAFRMSDSLYHRHALGFVACRGGNARLISASPVWIVRAYRLPSRYRHNGTRGLRGYMIMQSTTWPRSTGVNCCLH